VVDFGNLGLEIWFLGFFKSPPDFSSLFLCKRENGKKRERLKIYHVLPTFFRSIDCQKVP